MKPLQHLCGIAAIWIFSWPAAAANIQDASKEISAFFGKNPGKAVAILAFRHSEMPIAKTGTAKKSNAIAVAEKEAAAVQDRFVEQLVASGAVTVIERDRIEQVLREHQIDQSGATEKTRIGKLLQAD